MSSTVKFEHDTETELHTGTCLIKELGLQMERHSYLEMAKLKVTGLGQVLQQGVTGKFL